MLKGINHLTFSVSDLDRSVSFYQKAFAAKPLLRGKKTAYFDLAGVWVALNEQREIPREEIRQSYTHVAFTVDEADFSYHLQNLKNLGACILPGREREEGEKRSVYFTDPDGHLFEFHTGTLQERLDYYRDKKADMTFY